MKPEIVKPANYNPRKHIHNHKWYCRRVNHPKQFNTNQWKRALKHFRWHCAYCGVAFTDDNHPTVDHVIPLSHSETPGSVITNILPACASCNAAKHTSEVQAWLINRFGDDHATRVLTRIQSYFQSIQESVS